MSVVYLHQGANTICRIQHKGGSSGPTWFGGNIGVDCSDFCNRRMQADSLEQPGWGGHPYYVRCYDNSYNNTPVNGRTVQVVSQIGTIDLDPSLLPITPITNYTACMRMLFSH